MENVRIKIVGAGKVGTAFAWHLQRLGYEISEIRDRDPKKVQSAWRLLKRSNPKPQTPAPKKEVLFLTVPDSEIAKEFERVKENLSLKTIVIHCSGVYGIEIFPVQNAKLETLALHPIRSFYTPKQAIADLPGSFFVLDGTKQGLAFGKRIVRQLKGKYIIIRSPDRPLYHTMCIFASNFLNALFESAERIGKKLGIPERTVREMLIPLAEGVLRNIKKSGPVVSLTGPVIRGDSQTVNLHIRSLKAQLPELVALYKELTRRLKEIKDSLPSGLIARRRLLRSRCSQ